MKYNNTKKTFKHTLLALALGSIAMGSINISANETKERRVMVKIDKTDGQESMVDLSVDGVNEAFVLPELSIGETRNITTQSGKEIIVSKTDKGLSVNIDGKDIALPGVGANLAAHIQRSMPLHSISEDSVQISGVELDDNQKQIIQDAFKSAGIDKKVTFSNKNIMIFQTGDHELTSENIKLIKNGENDFTWHSDNDGQIEVIVNSDSDSDVQVHTKVIHIEEVEDIEEVDED